ncbi:MAG: cupredoxin domain-containing protein [Actinobacteria bacterium]|nr:cupredoxin domain-containing protein [Actinomycetota bacterium]MBI3257597.1 cupredoxin domain-containing protein [Actinomycetota bacterium]
MKRPLIPITCALSTIAFLGAACGGGDGAAAKPTASSDADVVVVATDLAFDAKTYTAKEGSVSIEYLEHGKVPHTLRIDKMAGFKLSVNGKKSDSADVLLKAGDYTIYCDIPGHRQAGMEATLTVK